MVFLQELSCDGRLFILSQLFVFQISILLAQYAPEGAGSKLIYKIADGLIMLHFILDPLFYVLLRCFPNLPKLIFRSCWPHKNGQNSLATTDNASSPTLTIIEHQQLSK
jgi:hypothetical protein